jgi:hypothetical protein
MGQQWDNIRLMDWSSPLRPTIQDGLLTPEDRGSSEAILMLMMTKAQKAEIQTDGPHAMADRALQARLVPEARPRLFLARRIAAAYPDAPAFRSALRALAKEALETGQDQALCDANVPPALDRRTSAHECLAAAVKAQKALAQHPTPSPASSPACSRTTNAAPISCTTRREFRRIGGNARGPTDLL